MTKNWFYVWCRGLCTLIAACLHSLGKYQRTDTHFHKQLKSHKKKLTGHLAPWYFAQDYSYSRKPVPFFYLFFFTVKQLPFWKKRKKKKMTARKQTKKYNHLGVCKNIFSSTNISWSAVTGSNKIAPSWLPTAGLHLQHGCMVARGG